MSRLDENDLIGKFISALTIFGERSAALEARVLSELGAMRNDIQQLKQAVNGEQNVVLLPRIMEQQRLTVMDLLKQVQPVFASMSINNAVPNQPQQLIQHPPNVLAPPPKPITSIQPQVQYQAPIKQAPIEPQQAVVPPSTQSPAFGAQFRLQPGQWDCTDCYTRNGPASSECVSCTAPKGGHQQQAGPKPATNFKPQTFNTPTSNASLFGSGLGAKPADVPKPPVIEKKEEPKPIPFSFTPKPTTPVTNQATTGLFGMMAPKTEQSSPGKIAFSFQPPGKAISSAMTSSVTPPRQPEAGKTLFGGLGASPAPPSVFGSGNQSAASFASLANNTSGGSGFLNQTSSNAGIFSTNNKQSFLSNAATKVSAKKPTNADGEEDADETAPEEFAPDDSQFKRPDIVLPDLVEVKTGEENEEVLFSARCRLYRFLPGAEVKERGTGDLKLLKNSATGKVRCVMRREQVLKVCANFAISSGFEVHNTKRGDNVLTWSCKDFSDPEQPEGEFMTLICRFKDVDAAKNFKQIATSIN